MNKSKLRATKKYIAVSLALLVSALQSGCAGNSKEFVAVTDFELDRYLGTWYEIARLDHRFERDMSNVTANYSMRDDGGVRVLNRGYKTNKSKWDEAEGKAYFVGETDVGQLKVSFFGPFYGGYNIVELDKEGYQYALVAGPNLDYLWILARKPDLDPETLTALIEKAKTLGFVTDDLIYVDHSEL